MKYLPYSIKTPVGLPLAIMRDESTCINMLLVSDRASLPPASYLGCVLTRRPYDRTVALQRMQQAGAYLTTAEQVTFQLLNSAEDAK